MSEPKTKTIIFSKNRTLQLKSLLRSLRENSDMDDAEIDVIYTTEADIPYEPLMSQFACRFVRQGDFLADVREAVAGSDCSYVLFMVDDLICRDTFSLRRVESLLDRRSDIDCFSLRLGRNIQDGAAPDFESVDDDVLVWDTAPSLGRTWRYFWEVSSSLYRRDLVLEYIGRCDPSRGEFPQPFRIPLLLPHALSHRRPSREEANQRDEVLRRQTPREDGLLPTVQVLHPGRQSGG